MGLKTCYIGVTERYALQNICMVAAESFRKNAETFRALIDHKPDPDSIMQIHGEGAKRLAEQFDAQAQKASDFATMFCDADDFTVTYEDYEEEEA